MALINEPSRILGFDGCEAAYHFSPMPNFILILAARIL
jgi:hypothetical protein